MLSVAMTNQKASFSLLRNSAIDSSSRNTTGSDVKQAASVVKNFTKEKSSLERIYLYNEEFHFVSKFKVVPGVRFYVIDLARKQ